MTAALVCELHCELLRAAAAATGCDFQGVRAAAAHLARVGTISGPLRKRLVRVDDTFATSATSQW